MERCSWPKTDGRENSRCVILSFLVEWQSNESKTSSGRGPTPSGRCERFPSFVSATIRTFANCCELSETVSFQRRARSSRSLLVQESVDDPRVWWLGPLARGEELPADHGMGAQARQVHHLSASLRTLVHEERAHRAPRPEALQHPHQHKVRAEDHRLRSRPPDESAVPGREGDQGSPRSTSFSAE